MIQPNRIEQFQVVKGGYLNELYVLDSDGRLWVTTNSMAMPKFDKWHLIHLPSTGDQAGPADHE